MQEFRAIHSLTAEAARFNLYDTPERRQLVLGRLPSEITTRLPVHARPSDQVTSDLQQLHRQGLLLDWISGARILEPSFAEYISDIQAYRKNANPVGHSISLPDTDTATTCQDKSIVRIEAVFDGCIATFSREQLERALVENFGVDLSKVSISIREGSIIVEFKGAPEALAKIMQALRKEIAGNGVLAPERLKRISVTCQADRGHLEEAGTGATPDSDEIEGYSSRNSKLSAIADQAGPRELPSESSTSQAETQPVETGQSQQSTSIAPPLPRALDDPEQLVYIPPGWLSTELHSRDPRDQQCVWIEGFVIRRNPVTHSEYVAFLEDLLASGRGDDVARCLPATPHGTGHPLSHSIRTRSDLRQVIDTWHQSPTLPVSGVSWFAARAYATWLSSREGIPWRLPSEWEYEKAARGMGERPDPWGDHLDTHWGRMNSDFSPKPVTTNRSSSEENLYGISYLVGDVSTWCLGSPDAATSSTTVVPIAVTLLGPEQPIVRCSVLPSGQSQLSGSIRLVRSGMTMSRGGKPTVHQVNNHPLNPEPGVDESS